MPELCSFARRNGRDGSRGRGIWKRLQTGAFLAWLVLPGGCSQGFEATPPASPLEQIPPIVLDSLHFSGYRGTSQDLEVRAERAQVRPEQQLAELRNVEIQFRDTERGPVHVTADRGDFNLTTQAFVLHENVKGELGDGERFTTSEVRYDDAMRRLYTSEPVEIEHGRIAFRGQGMVLDVPSGRLTLNELSGATR